MIVVAKAHVSLLILFDTLLLSLSRFTIPLQLEDTLFCDGARLDQSLFVVPNYYNDALQCSSPFFGAFLFVS
jgi:hypothetical protein